MSDHKLIVHPVNAWAILHDPPQLLDALKGQGLIGLSFNYLGDLHFRPGPRFAELLVFRGEAPSAEAAKEAYHVGLVETTALPTFLGAVNAQGPVCSACQARIADWKDQLLAWQTERQRYTWRCAKCSQPLAWERLEWGSTGGVARYSLEVCGIPEGAAVPSAELLSALERETREPWRFFYYRL